MDEARALLKEYGHQVGLPALDFDAHGCARLRFMDDVAVNLEVDASGNCIHLYTVLGPVPAHASSDLMRRVLEANFFCSETQGATLCIDGVRNEFVLCRRFDMAAANLAPLAAAMDAFVGAVARCAPLLSQE